MSQREVLQRDIIDRYTEIKQFDSPVPADTTAVDSLPKITNNADSAQLVADNVPLPPVLKDSTTSNDTTSSDTVEATPDMQLDVMKMGIAKSYYELARNHYNIGNIDSANYYYEQAAAVAPLTQPQSSRYLYVYAESLRDTNA